MGVNGHIKFIVQFVALGGKECQAIFRWVQAGETHFSIQLQNSSSTKWRNQAATSPTATRKSCLWWLPTSSAYWWEFLPVNDSRVINAEETGDGLQQRSDAQAVESFWALSLTENASSTCMRRSWGSKSNVEICQSHSKLHSQRKTRRWIDYRGFVWTCTCSNAPVLSFSQILRCLGLKLSALRKKI